MAKFFRRARRNRKPLRSNAPKKVAVRKAIRRAVKSNFAKKVLSVIHNQAESKQAWTSFAPTDFNSGIGAQADACRIIPNISKGDDDNMRNGDQINPQSLTIRGIVQMLPQGTGQGDGVRKIAARLMIVTPKSFQTWASAYANATTWMPYLLRKGGTTSSFSGAIDDLYAPINTDAITCHYNKVFYLNQGTIITGTTTNSMTIDQSNLVRFFKKTIKFGKSRKFKYDANVDSGLTPSSAGAYVMILGYTFVDGTAPDTLSTRVRLQYTSVLHYEDY